MTEEQKWKASDLGNPVYALLLATFFQYGVMAHDLELDRVMAGKKKWSETAELRAEMVEWLEGMERVEGPSVARAAPHVDDQCQG